MNGTIAEKRDALKVAEEKVLLFLDAEDRIVRGGQTMVIDDGDMKRMVSRADAKWLSQRLSYWRGEVSRLKSEIANYGRPRRRGIYVRPM